jgi:hypothetical protein
MNILPEGAGERTAEEYQADGERVRREAEGVHQSLIRIELIGIAMKYEKTARIVKMLRRIRDG